MDTDGNGMNDGWEHFYSNAQNNAYLPQNDKLSPGAGKMQPLVADAATDTDKDGAPTAWNTSALMATCRTRLARRPSSSTRRNGQEHQPERLGHRQRQVPGWLRVLGAPGTEGHSHE